MWQKYICAAKIEDVLDSLAENKESARIVAGGTDIILEMEKGARNGVTTLIDVSRIPDLDQITLDENNVIHIAPGVTHNHCVSSKLIREGALPLALACWGVGSPQIRNRGTIAGNLATASPANDTITPLMALGAKLILKSVRGERVVALEEFYTGVRRTVMQSDEMIADIFFPALDKKQGGTFIKLALRQAQAISLVNVAVVLNFNGDVVEKAAITLGAVSPTIIHALQAEEYLVGKVLTKDLIEEVATLTMKAAKPISDVRGSAAYRKTMTKVITRRALTSILEGSADEGLPVSPVLLWGKDTTRNWIQQKTVHDSTSVIKTTINGIPYEFTTGQDKTLLRLLREDAGLIGTKEGCAEGECGACTLFLDGKAVMSCMVPAPRADGASIVTVEGLSQEGKLHPVQQAFVEANAVQCGYCTPGFIMSATKLLEERAHPSESEIKQAITGNLCRCTGYYTIVQAIDEAAHKMG